MQEAGAQGGAQVVLSGIPAELSSPYIAELGNAYQQGLFSMQFILNTFDSGTTDFVFHVTVDLDGTTVIDVTSDPVSLTSGVHIYNRFADDPAVRFQESFVEIIRQLDGAAGSETEASGLLPVGTYVLTVEAIPADPNELISSVPGIAVFNVRYAEPPVLITPFDEEIVTQQFPIFTWTAAQGIPPGSMIEYDLLVVEMEENQEPQNAIEGNAAHYQGVFTNQTSLTYTADLLPLQPGKTYAWQVEVRDTAGLTSFIDGSSEIFTFTYSEMQPVTWQFPSVDPFITFEIHDYQYVAEGLRVDGSFKGEVAGRQMDATFNDVVLSDAITPKIARGSVELHDRFALQAGFDPQSHAVGDYAAMQRGSDLDLDPGFLIELAEVVIDHRGLRAESQDSFDSFVAQSGPARSFSAVASEQFLLAEKATAVAGDRLAVEEGRVDFLDPDSQTAWAYLNRDGFFTTGEAPPTEEELPDGLKLPLPSVDIAFALLSDADESFVETTTLDNMNLELSTQPGKSVTVFFPALPGNPSVAGVELDHLEVSPTDYSLVVGQVEIDIPQGNPGFGPAGHGLPVELVRATFTKYEGLVFDGNLALFGEDFDSRGTSKISVDDSGVLSASFGLFGLSVAIPLVAGSDRVMLSVDSVTGDLQAGLLTSQVPTFDFQVGGSFDVHGEQDLAARAEVLFHYINTLGITQLTFIPDSQIGSTPIRLDGFDLQLRELTSLDLNYAPGTGFSFAAGADLDLQLTLGSAFLSTPLQNVELRETGFYIPDQQINTSPPMDGAPFAYGPVSLALLELRVPGPTTFDWFGWNEGQPSGLSVGVDFALTLSGFETKSPALAGAGVTLQGATLSAGTIEGDLLTYDFVGDGALIPLGGPNGFRVRSISGRLFPDGGQQEFDIQLTGVLETGGSGDPSCNEPAATLRLKGADGLAGTVSGFTPCDSVRLGPLRLAFSGADLTFDHDGSTQTAVLAGSVTADLQASNFSQTTATGTATFDLVADGIVEANLALENFTWSYPKGAPLFTFEVPRSTVKPDGLLFTGDGSLEVGGNQLSDVTFNDLGVGFAESEILSGNIQIQDSFGLEREVGTGSVSWSLSEKTDLERSEDNRALFVMPAGLEIGPDGLVPTGNSVGAVNALGVFEPNLTLTFNDGFQLGLDPQPAVGQGRAELANQGGVVATLDATGFHLPGGTAVAELPPQLGLPTVSTAYIKLRDAGGNLLVNVTDPVNGVRTLSTGSGQATTLVLAGLNPADPPQVPVTFDEIKVDETLNIVGLPASIQVDQSPFDLSVSGFGVPLELIDFEYASNGSANELTAKARLSLSGGFYAESMPGVVLTERLRFTDTGPQALSEGTVSEQHDEQSESGSPLVTLTYNDRALELLVRGVDLDFSNSSFRFSGDIRSKLFGEINSNPAGLHFHSVYDAAQNIWELEIKTDHLNGQLPIGRGVLDLTATAPLLTATQNGPVALTLSGMLEIPSDIPGLAVEVDELHLGSDEITVSGSSSNMQVFPLFGDFLTFQVDAPALQYVADRNAIICELGGKFETELTRKPSDTNPNSANLIPFRGMQVGTDDGKLLWKTVSGSWNAMSGNLLGNNYFITVIHEICWMHTLTVDATDDDLRLSVQGKAVLPMPGKRGAESRGNGTGAKPDSTGTQEPEAGQADSELTSNFSLVLDKTGAVTLSPISFNLGEWPPVEDGDKTEMQLGSIATFEITGAAVEFDPHRPRDAVFYATGALYVHSKAKEGTQPPPTGENKDSDGKDRIIYFGNPSNITTNFGIRATPASAGWTLQAEAPQGDALFSFTAGMFNIALTKVTLDPSDFLLKLGGRAGFALEKVSGEFAYEGFTINRQGIESWGGPTGSFNLTVMDLIDLGVGPFTFKPAEDTTLHPFTLKTATSTLQDGTVIYDSETIDVKEYLQFGSPDGTPALTISLGADAISGSVQQVLYYRDADDNTRFLIQEATMTIATGQKGAAQQGGGEGGGGEQQGDSGQQQEGGQGGTEPAPAKPLASLQVNLDLMTGENFYLKVSGLGKVREIGGAAWGKIAVQHDDAGDKRLSLGVFFAATGLHVDLLPIAPSTVVLSDLGGGFFIRPTAADLAEVRGLIDDLRTGGAPFPSRGFPTTENDLTFGVMIYGGLSLVKAGSKSALEGAGLLTVTNQFINLDLAGTLIEQTGQGTSQGKLYANGYLSVSFDETQVSVNGGVALTASYTKNKPGILNANGDIQFSVTAQNHNVSWAVWGNAGVTVVKIINVNGSFVASPDGLLTSLELDFGFDAGLLSASGYGKLETWYYRPKNSVGAYAEVGVKGEIFAGLVEVYAYVTGALLYADSDYLLYGEAVATRVIAGETKTKQVWLALEDGKWSSGKGTNEEYSQMIADSRSQSAEMTARANATVSAIQAANAARFRLSPEQVLALGLRIHRASREQRQAWADTMVNIERHYWEGAQSKAVYGDVGPGWAYLKRLADPFPTVFTDFAREVVVGTEFDADSASSVAARNEMDALLSEMDVQLDATATDLNDIGGKLGEFPNVSTTTFEPIESPLTRREDGYGFDVDPGWENQAAALTAARESGREADSVYVHAINTQKTNINHLDAALTRIVLRQGEYFPEVHEKIFEYYAKRGAYLGNVISSAVEKKALIQDPRWNELPSLIGIAGSLIAFEGTDKTDYEKRLEVVPCYGLFWAASRYVVLQSILDPEFYGQGQSGADKRATVGNDYIAAQLGRLYYAVGEDVNRDGMALWRDSHKLALEDIASDNRTLKERSYNEARKYVRTYLAPLEDSLTTQTNRLYSLKTEMIETLVEMMNDYIDRRVANGHEDGATAALIEERNGWMASLEPPRLDSFTMTPHRTDSYTTVDFDWNASHRSGPVSAVLQLRMLGDRVSNLDLNQTTRRESAWYGPGAVGFRSGLQQYVSAGFCSNVDVPAENSAVTMIRLQETVNLETVLGLRSPGGALFVVRSEPRISVSPGGDALGDVVTGPGDVLDGAAMTPPTAPEIVVVYGQGPRGSWTGDPSSVPVVISGLDPMKTFLSFETAVGTPSDPTGLQDWVVLDRESLEGTRVRYQTETLPPWSAQGNELLEFLADWHDSPTEVQVAAKVFEGLSLGTNREYRLSARSTNSMGRVSPTTQVSFRYDATLPEYVDQGSYQVTPYSVRIPTTTRAVVAQQLDQMRVSPVGDRPSDVGFYHDPQSYPREFVRAVPPVLLDLPDARDPDSDLFSYASVVSSIDDPAAAFASGTPNSITERLGITVPDASYRDSWYVHLEAINWGGGRNYLTMGPFPPAPDPTRPSRPIVQLGLSGETQPVVWLARPSIDLESGVRGYQFAVGTTQDGYDSPDVRPWPTTAESLDFPNGAYDFPVNGALAPGYKIDLSGIEAANMWIYFRAVNGQGVTSEVGITGGIASYPWLDQSPPSIAFGSGRLHQRVLEWIDRTEESLDINFEMQDPGSGILKVAYRIDDFETDAELTTGTLTYDTPICRISGMRQIQIPQMATGFFENRLLRVRLTATNGAGLETTTSGQLDLRLSDYPPPDPTVNLTWSSQPPTLAAQVQNAYDPVYGIKQVAFRLEEGNGAVITDWSSQAVSFHHSSYVGGDPGNTGHVRTFADGPWCLDRPEIVKKAWTELSTAIGKTLKVRARITYGDDRQTEVAGEIEAIGPPPPILYLHRSGCPGSIEFSVQDIYSPTGIANVEFRALKYNPDRSYTSSDVLVDWTSCIPPEQIGTTGPHGIFPSLPYPPGVGNAYIDIQVRITNGNGQVTTLVANPMRCN